jgi:hypothetical protein
VSLIFCPRSAFDWAKNRSTIYSDFGSLLPLYILPSFFIFGCSFSLHSEITLLFSFSLFFLLNYSVVSIIERLLPYRVDIRISIIWCNSGRSLQCSSASYFILKRLFYPGDFAVDILQCTSRVVPRNVLKKAT